MRIIFGDRATFEVEGDIIDVNNIAIDTAKKWLNDNLRFVNAESVEYQVEIAHGSAELTDIFKRRDAVSVANDTLLLWIFPMTPTEILVLRLKSILIHLILKTIS